MKNMKNIQKGSLDHAQMFEHCRPAERNVSQNALSTLASCLSYLVRSICVNCQSLISEDYGLFAFLIHFISVKQS